MSQHRVQRCPGCSESLDAGATGLIGSRTVAVLMRPVSTDDVATALAHVSVGVPLFGVLEVAGPAKYHLDELTAKLPAAGKGHA